MIIGQVSDFNCSDCNAAKYTCDAASANICYASIKSAVPNFYKTEMITQAAKLHFQPTVAGSLY